jgi:hypothetical protein
MARQAIGKEEQISGSFSYPNNLLPQKMAKLLLRVLSNVIS